MADDNDFTVKDYDRIIDDIMNEFFDQHDIEFDFKDLVKVQMIGDTEDVPVGYHRMGDGSLMLDSDMPGLEGGQ